MYSYDFKCMQMAEQLLISGCIDEAQLQSMDMVRAHINIGKMLLSHSGSHTGQAIGHYITIT